MLFCAVAAGTTERVHFWGRDGRLRDFVRCNRDALFVSHNMVAEAKYLLRLGAQLPERWFDTMLAWRYLTNAERVPPYGLSAALEASGLSDLVTAEKKELQQQILHLRFDDAPQGRRAVLEYCFRDCEGAAALYGRLRDRVDARWMGYMAEYAKAVAAMELKGLPFDAGRWGAIRERAGDVVAWVTAGVNAVAPVFSGPTLRRVPFFRWCAANGIGWPRRVSPRTGKEYLPLDDDALDLMKERHPFVRAVREARKTTQQLTSRGLTVDAATGLHHFDHRVLGAATGRTTTKGCVLQGPKWMRFLIVPPSPDHVLVYADYSAQEISIAAHLSHDAAMREGYDSGDPHMALAVRAGAAPPGATKATHPAERARYKAPNLGVNYGLSEYGLAAQLGTTVAEGRKLLDDHRRLFPEFWRWSDAYVCAAYRRRRLVTPAGFPRRVGRNDNPRSVMNFPVQGAGGDLMRLSAVYLVRQGVDLRTTLHDGFLMACRRRQLADLRQAIDFAFNRAVQQLLPGAAMRWEVEAYEERFADKDGKAGWGLICRCLDGEQKARQPTHNLARCSP